MPEVDQRLEALATANKIRAARRELKDRLHHTPPARARRVAAHLIRECPWWIATMPVGTLIAATRMGGPHLIRRVLRPSGIDEWTRIGSLTHEERDQVADLLAAEAAAYTRRRKAPAA